MRLKSGDVRARRVAQAMREFDRQQEFPDMRATADALNISHKHFIEDFRRVTGLTPKLYCRIQRFQRVLSAIKSCKEIEWAAVAVNCGYFDQAHFIGDFTAFSGVNPSAYIRHRLDYPGFIRASDER
jgi:methylphosphotriester-DNA--protein-cysteine methyltransferase